MARLYTANDLQKIIRRAYMSGFDDGRNFHNRPPDIPDWKMIVPDHPVDRNVPHRVGVKMTPDLTRAVIEHLNKGD